MTHLRVLGFGVCVLSGAMAMASCSGTTPPVSQPTAVDNRPADEAAIRAADAAWSKAAGDKDPARTASYYADGAVLMAAGSPMTTGKDAIQKAFAEMMANPAFALSFAPTKVIIFAPRAFNASRSSKVSVRSATVFDPACATAA